MENRTEHHTENELLGFTIKHEGKVEMRWRNGKQVEVHESPIPWAGLPPNWKPKHQSAFDMIVTIIGKLQQSKRGFPLTQAEVITLGIKKKLIQDLIEFNMVGSTSVPLTQEKNGKSKNIGNRTVLYFTAFGFSYLNHRSQKIKAQSEASIEKGQK